MELKEDLGFSEETLNTFRDSQNRIKASNKGIAPLLLHLISAFFRFSRMVMIFFLLTSKTQATTMTQICYMTMLVISLGCLACVIRASYRTQKILNPASKISLRFQAGYIYYASTELGVNAVALYVLFLRK